MQIFTKLKTDPHVTELKGRHHRLSHSQGLMELSFQLTDEQREQFNAKSKELFQAKVRAIDNATETLNSTIAQAKKTASQATNAAHDAYEAAVFALFMEFGKLPSREQIAISETPVGSVVRMNDQAAGKPGSHDSAPPQAAPSAA